MTESTILIVDDIEANRQTLESLLDYPELQLHHAADGATALARAAELQPDLILLDVMMPGMDGFEVCRRLRSDPQLAEVPIVMVSALDERESRLRGIDAGADDFVTKPFDRAELRARIRGILRLNRFRRLQQAKGTIGDLEHTVTKRTAELRESEEHFRLIAENAADLIAVLDTNGGRIYTSPSYEKVLGLSPESLRKTPASIQIHPKDKIKVLTATQIAIQTGVAQALEYRTQHRDGSWRVLDSQANPVRNARGEIDHLVMVERDITERKKEEEERRQMEWQLRHAQKMESIGQLAAGIAHEINTPTQYIGDNTHFVKDAFHDLSGLLAAYSRLLEAAKNGGVTPELAAEVQAAVDAADVDYLTGEIPKAIDQCLQGVSHVSKIVGAMKDFSHPGSSEKSPIDLNRAIESTITVATNEWKYVASIATDFDATLPSVPCLPGEFNQVILNIVVNASHAIADVVGDGGRGKGTISVSTRRDGDWAEIRIRDSGTGIPEHVRCKIFDPFFTTKGVGKGTGQGLAIAHSVMVDKHGGSIQVESEVGQGTTFILRLPIHPQTSEKAAA